MNEQTPDKHLIRLHNLRCEAELTDPLTKLKLEGLIETIEHYRNTRTTDRLVAKIELLKLNEFQPDYEYEAGYKKAIDDCLAILEKKI